MPTLPLGNRHARLLEATNSQAAMKTALQAIPWNRLSHPAKEKIQSVLSSKPLYRRLPQQSAYCEPVMYDFLLNHPDVVVAIWEKLGVTQISLKEHGRPGVYQLRETIGSAGIIEVLFKTRNYCIAYSKGTYTGPYLQKPVEGETVLILQSVFEQDEEGDPYVVTQLDAFVKVNNFGVDMFAKVFAPILGRIADKNFEETIAFLGNVSEAAQTNPEVVKRLALRLESIRQDVREEFIQVAYQTTQMAIDRSGGGLNNPYGRQLLQRQTVQTERQRQEFEQARNRYLQNLAKIQAMQNEQNPQQGNLPSALRGMRQEMTSLPTPLPIPLNKQPVGPLGKPKAAETDTFTFEDMSPNNDFSRNLEIIDKITPPPLEPAQNATPLNLDLDLDLSSDKPVSSTIVSNEKKPKNEPAVELNPGLKIPKQETPQEILQETPQNMQKETIAKTTPKLTAVTPQKTATPQKDSVSKNTPPVQTATTAGKTGKVVFGTPTISR